MGNALEGRLRAAVELTDRLLLVEERRDHAQQTERSRAGARLDRALWHPRNYTAAHGRGAAPGALYTAGQ